MEAAIVGAVGAVGAVMNSHLTYSHPSSVETNWSVAQTLMILKPAETNWVRLHRILTQSKFFWAFSKENSVYEG